MEFNLADLFENAVDHFGDREYLVVRGQAPHLRRDGGAGEPARPPPRGARHRARRPRRHLRATTRSSGSRRCGRCSSSARSGSTSTTATSRTSSRTSSTTPTSRRSSTSASSRPGSRGVLDRLPLLRHSIVIEDGSDADLAGLDSVDYEDAMASGSPERDFGAALRRRPLHPLHGRHDRHAQGRRVAPRGRVLRARRRHRPRRRTRASTAPRRWSRRASRTRRRRRCCRSPRSCTARRSGA